MPIHGSTMYWQSQMRKVVERGLRQDISSSPEMLRQATRHWGQPAALQRIFRKLMQGDTYSLRMRECS